LPEAISLRSETAAMPPILAAGEGSPLAGQTPPRALVRPADLASETGAGARTAGA